MIPEDPNSSSQEQTFYRGIITTVFMAAGTRYKLIAITGINITVQMFLAYLYLSSPILSSLLVAESLGNIHAQKKDLGRIRPMRN